METRANFLLIGSFVLVVAAGAVVFVVWLARVDIDRAVDRYRIYFEGSVAGLSVGSDVRYRGIKAGTVTDIGIAPQDPSRVRVDVEIRADTPIREGDEASLQLQGITGVAYVGIEGATAEGAPLTAGAAQAPPVIPSRPSRFEELYQSAPELLSRGIELLDRASYLLRDENQRRITAILTDLNDVSATIAAHRGEIERVLGALDRTTADVARTSRALREVATKADALMDDAGRTLAQARTTLGSADALLTGDLEGLIAEVRNTAHSVDALAGEAQAMLAENRQPINDFASDGLNQLARFVTEARLLVAGMSRFIERLESEGARFLLGGQGAEYEAK